MGKINYNHASISVGGDIVAGNKIVIGADASASQVSVGNGNIQVSTMGQTRFKSRGDIQEFEMRDGGNENIIHLRIGKDTAGLTISNGDTTVYDIVVTDKGDRFSEFGSLKVALKDLIRRYRGKE